MRWGPTCRITNLLKDNSLYKGLRGHHTPGRVGPDSHRRRLTGRLISKWDGLDHPPSHPLLKCRWPLVRRSKTYKQLFIFTPQGRYGRMDMWKYASLRSILTNQSSDLICGKICLKVTSWTWIIPTSRGFYRHFQSIPLSVCDSLMLQKIHHCAHTEEK